MRAAFFQDYLCSFEVDISASCKEEGNGTLSSDELYRYRMEEQKYTSTYDLRADLLGGRRIDE